MKRASTTYRLQMIKEVATRQQRLHSNDPMAHYIQHLLDQQPEVDSHREMQHNFAGNHFDEHVGGWVSDFWNMK
ncbi:hypothetical protein [Vibrio sp.]|uniref:hypothetical protein n=1 Tax=Vibrio sp. TaxID=678 RepID=UPI003D13D9F5